MKCETYTADVHELLDGSLPPARRRAMEAHLAACPACRAAVADERGRQGRLSQGLKAELAAMSLSEEVRRTVIASTSGRQLHGRAWRPRHVLTAAAALVVVVGLSLFHMSRRPGSLMPVYTVQVDSTVRGVGPSSFRLRRSLLVRRKNGTDGYLVVHATWPKRNYVITHE